MRLDLRLYLVTAADAPIDEVARITRAAVAGGVTIVQLRDKGGDSAARAGRAAQLAASGAPVIINDDIEAARLANVAGVHVGPDDRHPVEARALLGPDALIGWSIHSLDQLADREALAACDYLAASPVWSTPTKTDTTPPLGLDGVRALRAAMPARLQLVGIGGIGLHNAAEVIQAGADGVAVVSVIWSAPDPLLAAERLRESIDAALAGRVGRRNS